MLIFVKLLAGHIMHGVGLVLSILGNIYCCHILKSCVEIVPTLPSISHIS